MRVILRLRASALLQLSKGLAAPEIARGTRRHRKPSENLVTAANMRVWMERCMKSLGPERKRYSR